MRLATRYHAPLPASTRPSEMAPILVRAFADVDHRLQTAWDGASAAQRDTRRRDGGWSLREVLEHIALTNEGYLVPMTQLADALVRSPRVAAPWRATFVGKWLVRSLEMTIKMPAPRTIRPGPSPRPQVLEAVIETHHAVCTLVKRTAETDWGSVRMVSPFSRLVRPNFGDAVLAVLRHSERHASQIEALLQELPSAPLRGTMD
ncbi:MAG: DinB family protein [Gemmatimonadaceae bacterium]|nr:DinB family protein [Gemmatimonadaceae bacterium]